MSGIKAKISHALGRDKDTPAAHTGTGTETGASSGAGTTGTGMGTTGTGTGTAGSGMGTTGSGSGMGTTGSGMGTTGTEHHHSGTTGDLHTGGVTGATGSSGGYDTTGVNTTGVRGGKTRTDDEVVDSETFTKTEDHEVVIEKKAYELEHRPVEKQYKVETKYMGERGVPGGPTQLLGTEEREVDERVKEAPRGDREIIVENVDIPGGALRSGGARR